MRPDLILISLVFLCTMSCGVTSEVPFSERRIQRIENAEAGILFITMSFRLIEGKTELVDLEPILTMGHLKSVKKGSGQLSCRIEKSGTVTDEIYFDNPLFPHHEIYGEDGQLGNAEVVLDSAESTLRFPYTGGGRIVKIYDHQSGRRVLLGKYQIQ